ncbi:MAG TPA: hypothetical protein VH092_10920, partial [Urbifossiella sp.]|nr:hypothetical protein [Urbifossiella sp.]
MGSTPDDRPGRGDMCRVSAAHPCPVCRKPDWCLYSPDGSAAICSRVEEKGVKRCGDAGWLHRLSTRTPPPPAHLKTSSAPARAAKPAAAKDWDAEARTLASGFDGAARDRLATALGLPADVFARMPLIGAIRTPAADACWTFPEFDGAGDVVGL